MQKSFADVKDQLRKQYNYNPSSKEMKSFERLHKRIFCLCNLIYELSKVDNDRMLFLSELHSDLVLLLIVGSLGIKKAMSLSIRSAIEDTLRHIYYKDHPIELSLLNESDDNKITDKEMFRYMEAHPLYCNRNNFKKMLDQVNYIYHIESKRLHSTSINYFSSIKVISDLSRDSKILDEEIKSIIDLTSSLLTLIIIYHNKVFKEMNSENKALLLSCIKNQHKQLIHDL